MWFDWLGTGLHSTFDNENNMTIDKFGTIDSKDRGHVIAFDGNSKRVCLFAKVSRQNSLRNLGGRGKVERLRHFGYEMSRCMLNVKRGQQRGSDDDSYFIVGERANRNTSGIGEYKCKPGISQEQMSVLRTLAGAIVFDMEKNVRAFSQHLQFDESVAQQVTSQRNLNTVGKYSTAFSMGISYQSKCHTDKDFHYSLLTVAAPSKRHDGEIVYYFVFPEYKVKVPMRSGDVILFNPLVPHGCSNPRFEESIIMSAYSSRTTLFRPANVLSSID